MTILPEASVIIPTYNSSTLLDEQLYALARQEDAPNFEVIISDNNSTDNPEEIIKKYQDKLLIKHVFASARQGQSYARNYAVNFANSELLLFCDADDVVSPHWVARHCDGLKVSKNSITTGRSIDMYYNNFSEVQYDALQLFKKHENDPFQVLDAGIRYHAVIGCNFGVHKSLFLSVMGFDMGLKAGEDVDFGCRAQEQGGVVVHVPSAVIAKRERSTPTKAAKQFYIYKREDILITQRYGDKSPVPYSLKYSLNKLITLAPKVVVNFGDSKLTAEYFGNLGSVVGVVRYKYFNNKNSVETFDY